MLDNLFVYGSLVAAAGHPQGARLRQESLLIGPAAISGRIYRVSWYPALRPAETAVDRVHGEVYRLHDPVATLLWLDDYEGVSRRLGSGGSGGEYVRAEREVGIALGGALKAWVYLYLPALPASQHIPDGVWRG
jgi:gamma-glutamylcyclotransferase (GGCT)/AIG2-like uncharacterized protein YtfP